MVLNQKHKGKTISFNIHRKQSITVGNNSIDGKVFRGFAKIIDSNMVTWKRKKDSNCMIQIIILYDISHFERLSEKLPLSGIKFNLVMIKQIFYPFAVNAHPGHGDHSHDGFSVIHYFTEPEHIAVIVTLLVTVVIGLMIRRRSAARKTS
jgi:hypothetical protein